MPAKANYHIEPLNLTLKTSSILQGHQNIVQLSGSYTFWTHEKRQSCYMLGHAGISQKSFRASGRVSHTACKIYCKLVRL